MRVVGAVIHSRITPLLQLRAGLWASPLLRRLTGAVAAIALLPGCAGAQSAAPPLTATPAHPKVAAEYGKLPLSFEANQGQTDAQVKFLSRGNGYSLFLTDKAAVLSLTKDSGRAPD